MLDRVEVAGGNQGIDVCESGLNGGIAATMIAVQVRIDECAERTPLQSLTQKLQGHVCMGAVAAVNKHCLIFVLKKNMVGRKPITLKHGDALWQGANRRSHKNLLRQISKCKSPTGQERMLENKGIPYDDQDINSKAQGPFHC